VSLVKSFLLHSRPHPTTLFLPLHPPIFSSVCFRHSLRNWNGWGKFTREPWGHLESDKEERAKLSQTLCATKGWNPVADATIS
jgi:hypothetical protein